MDISQIRLNNLTAVLYEKFGGKKIRLAKAMKTNPNNLSRYYSDNDVDGRKISDEAARAIEVAAGKEHGWMDREHDDISQADYSENGANTRELKAIILKKLDGRSPVELEIFLNQIEQIDKIKSAQ